MNIKVLDHGYVRFVEHWGSDERIVEAARMSTDKGFLGWKGEDMYTCSTCKYACAASLLSEEQRNGPIVCPNDHGDGIHALSGPLTLIQAPPGDEKLLAYLYSHKHMTPFEMAGLTIEVQAPIFVFREWHRHRTQSYNEMSGRYIELPKMQYIPSTERIVNARQSQGNKQSSTAFEHGTDLIVVTVRTAFIQTYETAWAHYQEMLELGVARELAARVLPVSQYSRMRASTDLRNWLGFLTLRMDPAAQWEIRQYANIVASMIAEKFPRTYELFQK